MAKIHKVQKTKYIKTTRAGVYRRRAGVYRKGTGVYNVEKGERVQKRRYSAR